jgi:hypothetical protein
VSHHLDILSVLDSSQICIILIFSKVNTINLETGPEVKTGSQQTNST